MPGSARSPLRRIAVAGHGPVGLAAAIALRRALPRTEVIVVPVADDPAALADHAATTIPHSNAFHRRLAIEEAGLVVRAGASHRLATAFAGWTGGDSLTVHPYGAAPPDGVSAGAVSAELALCGRFAHPVDDESAGLSDIDYAVRFSPVAYRRHLATLANRMGVVGRDARLVAALPDGAGGIAQLKLGDGELITADLFVDCSGPGAHVARALPQQRIKSWAAILPCDRLLIPAQPSPPDLTPLDRIAATPMGWRSTVHGRDGTHELFAASAAVGSPEDLASAAGFEPQTVIAIEPGRREAIWQGNVVCFGDAAAQFEPLHWLNLGLAHAQIALFLELLPGCEPEPLERREFNRRAGGMIDRVRDFIALHYCAPRRAEGPFWDAAAALDRPASLQLTLAEFIRRGRLPFFEDELLPRDAWKFAMATIGVSPGPAARLAAVPSATLRNLAAAHRARCAAAVHQAQPYREWLAAYLKALQ